MISVICLEIRKQQDAKKAFGTAHWASMREIKKMGLLDNKDGLIIGEKYGRLLRAPIVSHALVFAPSRSGKGVSQVIPNALIFKHSMLLIDVKEEIFSATSGYRQKHGQFIALFAPLRDGGATMRWNPLDLIDKNSTRFIADTDLIVHTLIKYADDADSMWLSEARTLAKGLILWLMDSGRPFNIGELVNFIKGSLNFTEELTKIRNEAINEDGTININHTAFININNFLNKAEKEQSGVKSTLTAKLNLWDDPLIQAATACSDFDFRDMRRRKMTIYLGIPIDQIERLSPLMNLFIQLFLKQMTRKLPDHTEPYKVLVMLDEFCALGRMDVLKDGFAFLAGYNVHLMAIIQNTAQFYDHYISRDKSDVFFQNTDYKIAYRQNTKTDRDFVSEMCGMQAIKNIAKNFQHNVLGQIQTGCSESYISKPLISSDQVGRFSEKYGIALFNGKPAIKYKKVIYYKDKRFKERILPQTSIPAINLAIPKLIIKSSIKNKGEEEDNETSLLPAFSNAINRAIKQRDEALKKTFSNYYPS